MLTHKFLRYSLIAGLAYAIDIGGFWILTNLLISPSVANLGIKVLAALFGFFAHRQFTYNIKGKDEVYRHAFRYFGVALLYAPISTFLLVYILTFVDSPVFVKFGVDVALALITFLIASKFVFVGRST
jgi:putative flippase GtrA